VSSVDPSGEFTLVELSLTTAIQSILFTREFASAAYDLLNIKLANDLQKQIIGPGYDLYTESLAAIADAQVPEDLLLRSYNSARQAIAIGYLTLDYNLILPDPVGLAEYLVSRPPIKRLAIEARGLYTEVGSLSLSPPPVTLLHSLDNASRSWENYCGLAEIISIPFKKQVCCGNP
jgi:hypothetical protein